MKLSADQISLVADWVKSGDGLSEVQRKLESEFGLRMTYMDVRFLIDDLDIDLPEAPEPEKKSTEGDDFGDGGLLDAAASPGPKGKVSVVVDKLARPGALVSGSVTFSDGTKAGWLLDQMGRLSLEGVAKTYRPSESDMMAFQTELQNAVQRLGF